MTNPFSHKSFLVQAAIIGSCLFVFGCENDEKVIEAWTEKKEMVEVATQVVSYFSQQGHIRARLKAPEMKRYQSDTVAVEFAKSLHVDFFDSLKRVESWVDARYGKYYESLNKVFLRDSVKVITAKGEMLETSELWWDQNSKTFYTDKAVRITQRDKRIQGGKGLEAAQDMSWYLIKQPTGTVLVGDDVMPQQ
jgi:LPS export ABC transporter protein LptC